MLPLQIQIMQNLHSFAYVKCKNAFASPSKYLRYRWQNLPGYSEFHNKPVLFSHSVGAPRMASHIWHKQNAVKEKDIQRQAKQLFHHQGKTCMATNHGSIRNT